MFGTTGVECLIGVSLASLKTVCNADIEWLLPFGRFSLSYDS